MIEILIDQRRRDIGGGFEAWSQSGMPVEKVEKK